MQAYFLKTNLTKVCRHLSEKASKGRLLGAISSKITLTSPLTKEKERREMEERKRGEKAMVAPLVFIMATLSEKNCWT